MGKFSDPRIRGNAKRYHGLGGAAVAPGLVTRTPSPAIANDLVLTPRLAHAFRPAPAISNSTVLTPSTPHGVTRVAPVAISTSVVRTPTTNSNFKSIAPVAIANSLVLDPSWTGSIEDLFNGTGALAAGWTTVAGAASNVAGNFQGSSTPVASFRNDFVPHLNQSLTMVVDNVDTSCDGYFRFNEATGNGYKLSAIPSYAVINIVSAGIASALVFTGTTWAPGDSIGVIAIGSNLQLLKNGVVINSISDSTFLVAGKPGVGTFSTLDTIASWKISSLP